MVLDSFARRAPRGVSRHGSARRRLSSTFGNIEFSDEEEDKEPGQPQKGGDTEPDDDVVHVGVTQSAGGIGEGSIEGSFDLRGTREGTPVSHACSTDAMSVEPKGACWLCSFHGMQVTETVCRLVIDAIGHVELGNLVDQVHACLQTECPTEDFSVLTHEMIKTHITRHMLHPRVKIGLLLHDLFEMQRKLKGACVRTSEYIPECNNTEHQQQQQQAAAEFDANAVRSHLAISNQIAALYKQTEDRMMFSQLNMEK